MATNFQSGVNGSVMIGTVSYSFKNWKISSGLQMPSVNNFNGQGYTNWVGGLRGGELTLEGPWDVGNMPLITDNSYTFILGVSTSVSITVTAVVGKVEFGQDVEDAARVKVTAGTNGPLKVGGLQLAIAA